MRRSSFLTATTFLAVLLFAHAPAVTANDNTRVQSKGVILSGQLSSDGNKLLAEDDNEWTVGNTSALKGLEGRYVTVKCRMNPQARSIHVLSIVEPVTNQGARLGDAALRR